MLVCKLAKVDTSLLLRKSTSTFKNTRKFSTFTKTKVFTPTLLNKSFSLEQKGSFRYSTENSMASTNQSDKSTNIVWVDLEMSGLNLSKDVILEMACIVTDKDLNILIESEDIVINQPDSILNSMDDWCRTHHGESGLTAAVQNSTVSTEQCEKMMLDLIKPYTNKGTCVLAGNSVHVDRQYLAKYMPNFTSHLHYRIIDVSTIKELCKRWYPEKFAQSPAKKEAHRALDDIRESIKELQYYQKHIFQHQ